MNCRTFSHKCIQSRRIKSSNLNVHKEAILTCLWTIRQISPSASWSEVSLDLVFRTIQVAKVTQSFSEPVFDFVLTCFQFCVDSWSKLFFPLRLSQTFLSNPSQSAKCNCLLLNTKCLVISQTVTTDFLQLVLHVLYLSGESPLLHKTYVVMLDQSKFHHMFTINFNI